MESRLNGGGSVRFGVFDRGLLKARLESLETVTNLEVAFSFSDRQQPEELHVSVADMRSFQAGSQAPRDSMEIH